MVVVAFPPQNDVEEDGKTLMASLVVDAVIGGVD